VYACEVVLVIYLNAASLRRKQLYYEDNVGVVAQHHFTIPHRKDECHYP